MIEKSGLASPISKEGFVSTEAAIIVSDTCVETKLVGATPLVDADPRKKISLPRGLQRGTIPPPSETAFFTVGCGNDSMYNSRGLVSPFSLEVKAIQWPSRETLAA